MKRVEGKIKTISHYKIGYWKIIEGADVIGVGLQSLSYAYLTIKFLKLRL